MKKVAIFHQGFVPSYRKTFFERLELKRPGRYVVFHGEPGPDEGIPKAAGPYHFSNEEIKNHRRFGVIYQAALSRFLRADFAGVVLGHEVKYLSNWLLFAACRLTGRRVLFWGFGDHRLRTPPATSAGRASFRTIAWLKGILARQANGYLAYSKSGAEFLSTNGVAPERVFVLQNTIDMATQDELRQRIERRPRDDYRKELGLRPRSAVLLYVGRLVEGKKLDSLLAAAQRLKEDGLDVELVVVGDGPLRQTLAMQAERLDATVGFTGFLDANDEKLASLFYVASALVIPGYVGLAVNHAFAHGVPVVTRRHAQHSPEFDYIEDGINGLVTPDDDEAFVAALARLAGSPTLRATLAEGARRTAAELSLERMVDKFDAAVECLVFGRRPTEVATAELPPEGRPDTPLRQL
jgi:glycosyltransferase involved in cell wall biosynthesis